MSSAVHIISRRKYYAWKIHAFFDLKWKTKLKMFFILQEIKKAIGTWETWAFIFFSSLICCQVQPKIQQTFWVQLLWLKWSTNLKHFINFSFNLNTFCVCILYVCTLILVFNNRSFLSISLSFLIAKIPTMLHVA